MNATKELRPTYSALFEDLCYNISLFDTNFPHIPTITFHFDKGLDLELKSDSILYISEIHEETNTTLACTAFISSRNLAISRNIIGNFQQQNYW
eukprot:c30050_g1_i1 orf=138-419(+)